MHFRSSCQYTHGCCAPASWAARHTTVCFDFKVHRLSYGIIAILCTVVIVQYWSTISTYLICFKDKGVAKGGHGRAFAQPSQFLAQPSQTFAQPSQTFAQPSQTFAQPSQTFAQPSQTFAQPSQVA